MDDPDDDTDFKPRIQRKTTSKKPPRRLSPIPPVTAAKIVKKRVKAAKDTKTSHVYVATVIVKCPLCGVNFHHRSVYSEEIHMSVCKKNEATTLARTVRGNPKSHEAHGAHGQFHVTQSGFTCGRASSGTQFQPVSFVPKPEDGQGFHMTRDTDDTEDDTRGAGAQPAHDHHMAPSEFVVSSPSTADDADIDPTMIVEYDCRSGCDSE